MTSFRVLLRRGFCKRCPQCGEGSVFEKRFLLVEQCNRCGYEVRRREADTLFFMYSTTAALTGVCLLLMLAVTPKNLWVGRGAIVVVALALYGTTHDLRKSLALALNHYFDQRTR